MMGIALIRGILFPDYRFEPNIILIPFGMPLLMAGIASYLVAKKHLKWLVSSLSGLVSVYVSTIIGIAVYGISVGWHYITDDTESQAVFMATIGIQTLTYLFALGVFAIFVKRYNKYSQQEKPTLRSGFPLL